MPRDANIENGLREKFIERRAITHTTAANLYVYTVHFTFCVGRQSAHRSEAQFEIQSQNDLATSTLKIATECIRFVDTSTGGDGYFTFLFFLSHNMLLLVCAIHPKASPLH